MRIDIQHDGQHVLVTDRTILWFGLIWGVLGLACIAVPTVSTLAIELLVAALLVVSGVVRTIAAIQTSTMPARIPSLVVGLLLIGLGSYMGLYPTAGIQSLTFFLTVFFAVEALLALLMAYGLRGVPPISRSLFLNGVFDIVLCVIVISGWRTSASWFIGTLVGASMISLAIVFLTGWYQSKTNDAV